MMSPPKLTVLGGSTPFTAALFEAIACSDFRLQPHELMLFGRNQAALDVMTRRARHCLGPFGWLVSSTTSRAESLEGAAFVIHQIRYGDLDGREAGERLAGRFGYPRMNAWTCSPPVGYSSRVRREGHSEVHHVTLPECMDSQPDEPIEVTTAIFIREGVTRCVGVCELPETTAGAIAHMLGIAGTELQWEYVGLNHRGFLYDVSVGGQPLQTAILSALPSEHLPGVTRDDVETFQAVPLKYLTPSSTATNGSPRIGAPCPARDTAG